MAEVFGRYGKVAQIDLSASLGTLPARRSSLAVKHPPSVAVNDKSESESKMMRDAIKQLRKSMRSESVASLGGSQR